MIYDLIFFCLTTLLGAVFAFIGLFLLVNQANSENPMLPAWIIVAISAVFCGVAFGVWTMAFVPELVGESVPAMIFGYGLGLMLPAGLYWYFASRNPNKSKFINAVVSAL